jgi:acyl transferase domain-containing protein
MNNRGGHYLKQKISAFDAPFFSISRAEAVAMDPQQRILLEVVYEATESAGIPMSKLSGTKTSCFVGCLNVDYKEIQDQDKELVLKYDVTGTGRSMLSNRISFFVDLKGPSVTLDTACRSGLVCVHLACQSLRTGESKAAVVAASSVILGPGLGISGTKMHLLSPDSTCFAFDQRANGYGRGEGVAALILKPLDEAIKDADTIRAVIRGTGVNHDGRTAGIMLPSREAQVSLIRTTYDQAGCDLSVTGYFEAHGTGTPAGDVIESNAVGEVFAPHRPTLGERENASLYMGSVKPNIGHL